MESKSFQNVWKSAAYFTLMASIKYTIQHGLIHAQKALEYQRLKTYWKIGKEILNAVEASKGEMQLGESLYEQLSEQIQLDLNIVISSDTLFRAIQFNRDHAQFPEKTPLTFTHYIILHRVHDAKKRMALEKKAIQQNFSTIELKNEVVKMNVSDSATSCSKKKKLQDKRGELYVYQFVPQSTLPGEKELFIDCGFKIYLPLFGEILNGNISTKSQQKRIIKAKKENGRYQIVLHKNYAGNLYTYAAVVQKIVDGDTFDVRIDVGFGIHLNERIRLKSINAPEIKTQEGKRVKAFLVKYFTKCPLILIRTEKAGMYGRWLADVFTLPKAKDVSEILEKGTFFNQYLLDEGLVTPY